MEEINYEELNELNEIDMSFVRENEHRNMGPLNEEDQRTWDERQNRRRRNEANRSRREATRQVEVYILAGTQVLCPNRLVSMLRNLTDSLEETDREREWRESIFETIDTIETLHDNNLLSRHTLILLVCSIWKHRPGMVIEMRDEMLKDIVTHSDLLTLFLDPME